MEMKPPEIKWIKFDENKHKYFQDGDRYLLAFLITDNESGSEHWEFESVRVKTYDEEGISLVYDSTGDFYSAFNFNDCEYFHIIEGSEPTERFE